MALAARAAFPQAVGLGLAGPLARTAALAGRAPRTSWRAAAAPTADRQCCPHRVAARQVRPSPVLLPSLCLRSSSSSLTSPVSPPDARPACLAGGRIRGGPRCRRLLAGVLS